MAKRAMTSRSILAPLLVALLVADVGSVHPAAAQGRGGGAKVGPFQLSHRLGQMGVGAPQVGWLKVSEQGVACKGGRRITEFHLAPPNRRPGVLGRLFSVL